MAANAGRRAKDAAEVSASKDGAAISPVVLFAGSNQDNCGNCNLGGELLCCETCPQAFHFLCAEPPVDPENIPDEAWYCSRCRPRTVTTTMEVKEPFKSIAERYLRSNPLEFKPPARVIQKYESLVTKNKKRRSMGKESTTCFSCSRGTQLVNRMQCSQCPLVYHIDCLKEPGLAAEPVNFNGAPWLCPNHAEHHLARRKRPRISQRGQNSEVLTAAPDSMKLDFIKKIHKERKVDVERTIAEGAQATALESEQKQFLGGILAFQQEWWEQQWNNRAVPAVLGPKIQGSEVPMEDAQALAQNIDDMTDAQRRSALLKLRQLLRDGARADDVTRHETGMAQMAASASGRGTAAAAAAAKASRVPPGPQPPPVEGCIATLRSTKTGEVFIVTRDPFLIGTSRPDPLTVASKKTSEAAAAAAAGAAAEGGAVVAEAGAGAGAGAAADSSGGGEGAGAAASLVLDLDLELELAVKEADEHHATIFYDDAQDRLEFLNHSEIHAVWVDGLACTAKQKESRILGQHNVIEIAGLSLVFDRTSTSAVVHAKAAGKLGGRGGTAATNT